MKLLFECYKIVFQGVALLAALSAPFVVVLILLGR